MTYDEFKKKYNGKFVDYDGQYGAQCWDLAQMYFTKVLKLPASVLSGCGLVSNMLHNPKRKQLDKYFTEVKTPEKGDVAIWEYGHIAIFDHKTGNTKYYFSQNPNPAKVMKITTGGVHFFRKKGSTPTPTPTPTNIVAGGTYKLLQAKALRTSPKLANNIVNAKYVDSATKKLLVKQTGNAMLKAGTEITCKKISKEKNGRTWGSYGNCWVCLKDASGKMNVKRVK